MSKRQTLSIIGVWVMVFIFLGIPSIWHKIIAIVTGLIIIAIAYNTPPAPKKNIPDNFIENNKIE
ncbi:MAG TPA: hypothetical protein VI775_01350 [Candidatus Paceibacterota bacterium]